MAKIFVENFVFQPKRKTAAEWESENPILRDGEFGVVTDGSDGEWLKVGDGVTAWNSLPYKKGPKGDPFTYADFTDEQLASLKGKDGTDGKDGTNGKDGYTPQKGVDYFTEDDIASLNIPSVDQTYTPTSENAQSGKAVAEAIVPKADKTEVDKLRDDLDKLQRATDSDVGKALKAKTITNGKVTEWEFGDTGDSALLPLIDKFTLDTKSSVMRTSFPDSTAYNLKEVAIYIYIPKEKAIENLHQLAYLYGSAAFGVLLGDFYATSFVVSGQETSAVFYFKKISDKRHYAISTVKITPSIVTLYPSRSVIANPGSYVTDFTGCVRRIAFTELPEGSTVEIYGVNE